jgi:hypothetical protein
MEQKNYITYKDKYNKKYGYTKGKSHTLAQVSKDTGVSLKGLQQIYNKGIGAYKTNPQSVRPNVKSKEQWAMARVYSAVMGGKASKIDSAELKMAKGGLVAPNGLKSNLTPLQYKLVRTPAFKAWFGDWENDPANASKVVDENGEPKVVYHGSKVVNIEIFNTKVGAKTKSKMQLLFGTHFAQSVVDAEIYAKEKGKIYETFLSIKNPIDLSFGYVNRDDKNFQNYYNLVNDLKLDKKNKNVFDYDLFTDIGDYGGKSKHIQRIFITQNHLDQLSPKNVRDSLIKNNFDGVIYIPYQPIGLNQISNFSKSFIALEPNQIKLADGTNKTFDGNNPDIRFECGGRAYFGEPIEFYQRTHADGTIERFSVEDYEKNIYPLLEKKMKTMETGGLVPRRNPKGDVILEDAWLITRDEYNEENLITHLPKGTKPDKATLKLQDYFAQITNISHTSKVNQAIEKGLYIEAVNSGKMTRQRANEIISSIGNTKDLIPLNETKKNVEGGNVGQEITCKNCGWHWNTNQSEEFDKYVCHNCGFDNAPFYSKAVVKK